MVSMVLPPLAVAVLLIVLWQGTVMALNIKPYLLPSPFQVFQAIARDRWSLLEASWLTARCALTGFTICLVLGTALGLIFARSPFLRRGLYPYAVFLQTVPIIAVAPLILNWLGPGFASMVTVVVVVAIFPIIANVTEGALSVDRSMRDLFRVYGATAWQTLRSLEFPFVIPHLLTGARSCGGLSVIGAIVGEFFAGHTTRSHGLGFLIPQRIQWMKTDEAFAAVLAATVLGLAFFATIGWLRSSLLARWCRR
jgi:NitT/TauT family transport system permease protein